MAVPKRRTPAAKQGNRRSHLGTKAPQMVRERGGNWRINHTVGANRDRKGRPIEDDR